MLIAPLPPHHNLVLNKFAIVPEHFILATREWKEQTDLLDADDLEAAYRCVQGYGAQGKELYVFYNSGEGSGSSQPHRHLQLLAVERMKEGLEGTTREDEQANWDVLAKSLLDPGVRDRLPFKTFAQRIGGDKQGVGEALREVYLGLYREGCKALGRTVEGEEIKGEGKAEIDYNLAMTRDVMVLMPRVQESEEVKDKKGEAVGKLALNGTVLAGTALVKSQREWDALREDEGQVRDILGRIGIPVTGTRKVGVL